MKVKVNVMEMFAQARAERLDKELARARQEKRVDKSVPTPTQEYVATINQRGQYTRAQAIEFSGIVAKKREERLAKRNPAPVKQGKTVIHLSARDNAPETQLVAEVLPLVRERLQELELTVLRDMVEENGLSWPAMARADKAEYVDRLYTQAIKELRQ